MATIPVITARRSLDPGGVVQYPTGDPVGAALEKSGTALTQQIAAVNERQQQQQRFDNILKLNEHTTVQRGELERVREQMPGATGIYENFTKTLDERDNHFLTTVPKALQPEFAARLRVSCATFDNLALETELQSRRKFELNKIVERADTAGKDLLANPQALPAWTADVEETIDAGTLPPAIKADAKRKAREQLAETAFRGLATRDPAASQEVAESWGTSRAGHAGNAALHPIIDAAAKSVGLDPAFMRRVAKIESGGNPQAVTGSYKGLFQMSDAEFQKYGGGNIFDPVDNANAAARKTAAEVREFTARVGRPPTPTEIYLQHQQGVGGLSAHLANPDRPAWQNMASTAEGRQKGEGWARQAIWGNVPDAIKKQFPGGVDTLTSADFVKLWRGKVEGGGGGDARFADIPPEKRLSLGGEADVAVERMGAQQAVAQQRDYQSRLNALQIGILDNRTTSVDVQQARDEG